MNTPNSIYHNLSISKACQEVYDAISLPVHLVNWWPQRCSGKPNQGEVYNFYFTDEYDWYGKVIKAAGGQAFHIKMIKSDRDWDPTSFGFDLSETLEGCNLAFWHTGWPECNHHFKRSSFCWAILLNNLKNYIEKDIIVPFEERA